MIRARINQGRVEVQEPIPTAWEGHLVKLVPSHQRRTLTRLRFVLVPGPFG